MIKQQNMFCIKKIIYKFIIFTVALSFSLLFVEFVLRLISPPMKLAVGTMQSPKAMVYGWAHMPNKRTTAIDPDTGKISYFTTNSEGWKDVEHKFKKAPGTVRILFLGDSFTWGVVGLSDLYTRQAESLLKKRNFLNVEVISIGIGGWSTDQELEALRIEGIRYHPDFVIYQFCDNDVTGNLSPQENTSPKEIFWKKQFKYKLENGVLKKIKLKPGIKQPSNFLSNSALIFNINKMSFKIKCYIIEKEFFKKAPIYEAIKTKHWWDDYKIISDPYIGSEILNEGWELLEVLILKMKSVCEKNNAKFLIFSPAGENRERIWDLKWGRIKTDGAADFIISNGKKYPFDTKRFNKKLIIICERNKIPLIKPKRQYDRYNFDPHPNEIGNLRMAQDIVDFLVNWKPFLKKFGYSKL